MFRNQRWLSWVVVLVALATGAVNLSTPRPDTYLQADGEYNINKLVEERHWIESAPIVLTNHFATVDVYRLGNSETNGISFAKDLVRIFKVRHIDSKPPIDIRSLKKWSKIQPHVQYTSNAACRVNERSGICLLYLVWDASNSSPNREFVNARVGDASFALIDVNLLRNVVGLTSW